MVPSGYSTTALAITHCSNGLRHRRRGILRLAGNGNLPCTAHDVLDPVGAEEGVLTRIRGGRPLFHRMWHIEKGSNQEM